MVICFGLEIVRDKGYKALQIESDSLLAVKKSQRDLYQRVNEAALSATFVNP